MCLSCLLCYRFDLFRDKLTSIDLCNLRQQHRQLPLLVNTFKGAQRASGKYHKSELELFLSSACTWIECNPRGGTRLKERREGWRDGGRERLNEKGGGGEKKGRERGEKGGGGGEWRQRFVIGLTNCEGNVGKTGQHIAQWSQAGTEAYNRLRQVFLTVNKETKTISLPLI